MVQAKPLILEVMTQMPSFMSMKSIWAKNQAVYTFKKKENYVIKAEKQGCKTTAITPQKSFDPTTLLGLLIDWGIISILVVDGAATGSWQKFAQTSYVVDPDCQ